MQCNFNYYAAPIIVKSYIIIIIIIDIIMGIVQIKAVRLWHWSAAVSKPTREGHRMSGQGYKFGISWEGGSHAVT